MRRIIAIVTTFIVLLLLSCEKNENLQTDSDQDNYQERDEDIGEQNTDKNDEEESVDLDTSPSADNDSLMPDEDTAVACGDTHFVMVYGDTRDDMFLQSQHPQVVAAMMNDINTLNPPVEAIFNTGDLVYDGNNDLGWNDFFNEIDPFLQREIPYYPVLGNHEYESQKYFDRFDLPGNEQFYIMDIYGIRFFVLDSNIALDKNSGQYKWLESELINLPAHIFFVAVLFHHPLYSTGPHGGDKELRAILHPLFVDKKVDMVFNGHDHAYEHLEADGLSYFVTGGGGAPLYSAEHLDDASYSTLFKKVHHYILLSVNDCEVVLLAKDSSNEVFDTITFSKQLKN